MTKKQRTIIGVTLLLLPFAYIVGSEIYYALSIRPRGIQTIADHYQRFGEPRDISQVQRGGTNYYELSGRVFRLPLLAFPSSPPTYVYDESGKFVDWCSDPGDQPSFRERWPRAGAQSIEPAIFRHKYGL